MDVEDDFDYREQVESQLTAGSSMGHSLVLHATLNEPMNGSTG